MKTTLNAIREHRPCASGWKRLLAFLGKTEADDEPIDIRTILKSNGLDDALWCLRSVSGREKEIRTLLLRYARHVEHLSSDPRVKACNDVLERYINDEATDKELWDARAAAWAAAWAAARIAGAAARAAGDAAGAAELAWQESELIKLCEECEKEDAK